MTERNWEEVYGEVYWLLKNMMASERVVPVFVGSKTSFS